MQSAKSEGTARQGADDLGIDDDELEFEREMEGVCNMIATTGFSVEDKELECGCGSGIT